MLKIYRILGKRGRITIPYAIRILSGLRYNDLVSFSYEDGQIVFKREKICDHCHNVKLTDVPYDPDTLITFLDSLSPAAQRHAMNHLLLAHISSDDGTHYEK